MSKQFQLFALIVPVVYNKYNPHWAPVNLHYIASHNFYDDGHIYWTWVVVNINNTPIEGVDLPYYMHHPLEVILVFCCLVKFSLLDFSNLSGIYWDFWLSILSTYPSWAIMMHFGLSQVWRWNFKGKSSSPLIRAWMSNKFSLVWGY